MTILGSESSGRASIRVISERDRAWPDYSGAARPARGAPVGEMSREPLVSIAVPTYNGARWIGAAIESVLAQTHERFELVVSDGGSTDDTAEIVRSYGDPRIRIDVAAKRLPAIANWNRSVILANGEYVKFLHQDDTIVPTCLEEMLAVATGGSGRGARLRAAPDRTRRAAGQVDVEWSQTYADVHEGFRRPRADQRRPRALPTVARREVRDQLGRGAFVGAHVQDVPGDGRSLQPSPEADHGPGALVQGDARLPHRLRRSGPLDVSPPWGVADGRERATGQGLARSPVAVREPAQLRPRSVRRRRRSPAFGGPRLERRSPPRRRGSSGGVSRASSSTTRAIGSRLPSGVRRGSTRTLGEGAPGRAAEAGEAQKPRFISDQSSSGSTRRTFRSRARLRR